MNFTTRSIHLHQYELLKSWQRKGNVALLIVYFKIHNKYYLLPFETLQEVWEGQENGDRKSIAWEIFENECKQVVSKDGYLLHYLDAIEG
ncbi:Holliday junction resolvase RecU [Lysinibacillus fusiformis]